MKGRGLHRCTPMLMYRETLKVHMCTWHGHRRGFKKRNIVMALLVRRLAWNKKKHGTIRNKNSYSYWRKCRTVFKQH